MTWCRSYCVDGLMNFVFVRHRQAADKPWIRDVIIGLTGKEQPSVLYIGTPGFDALSGFHRQVAGFADAGLQTTMLNLSDLATVPSSVVQEAAISAADIIVVSGGNTLHAVNRWRRIGVDRLLKTAMQRGAVLAGGSAGAICWFEGGHSDSLDPNTVQRARCATMLLSSRTPCRQRAVYSLSSRFIGCRMPSQLHGLAQNGIATASTIERLPAAERALYLRDWKYCRVKGLGFLPFFMCPHHDQTQSNGVSRSGTCNPAKSAKNQFSWPCAGRRGSTSCSK